MFAILLQGAHAEAQVNSHRYAIGFSSSPLLTWLIIGLLAGWLAGLIGRGEGYGCIADILLGLIGSVLGGWLFMKLGIFGGGFLYSLAAATVGAVILVLIVHLFSPRLHA